MQDNANNARYSGIKIDENLNWKIQLNFTSKLNRVNSVLSKPKFRNIKISICWYISVSCYLYMHNMGSYKIPIK